MAERNPTSASRKTAGRVSCRTIPVSGAGSVPTDSRFCVSTGQNVSVLITGYGFAILTQHGLTDTFRRFKERFSSIKSAVKLQFP